MEIKENHISPLVISLLNKKTGKDVTTPSGASYLRDEIVRTTKTYVALNTVKRLLGIIPYKFTPRSDTLDLFAKYLGFENWKFLQDYINNNISGFNELGSYMNLNDMNLGSIMEISWLPDRQITIINLGDNNFKVLSSQNSKLKEEDILTISHIAIGCPFVVKKVIRDNEDLGYYIAAKEKGVKDITFQ